MTARVQIQIEAQDASSGVLRAITSQFGALGGAVSDMADVFNKNTALMDLYERGLDDSTVSIEDMARAEEAAGAATARFAESIATLAIEALKQAIDKTVEYAQEVEKIKLVSGATAEQASRLIQVLDDYGVTAADITTATRIMTKNGFAPTIETIMQLSNEYNSLNTAQEKNAFLVENLGRGGAEWAKVLSLGSDALRDLNENVNTNLILTDAQIRAAEEYRLNVDQLEDSWNGVVMTVGNRVIPALNNLFTVMNKVADAQTQFESEGRSPYEAHRLALMGFHSTMQDTIPAIEAYADRYQGLADLYSETAPTIEEVAAATELMTKKNEEFLSMLGSAQSTLESYHEKNQSLAEERIKLEEQKTKLISQGYSEQGSKVQEVNAKLDENKKKSAEVAAQFDLDNKKIILGYLERKLTADGTLTDDELNWLLEKGEAWGIYSEEAIAAMQAAMDEANNLINTYNSIPANITTNVNTNYNTTGNPPSTYGSTTPYASGGEVYAGSPVVVGENGKEPFIPSQNGRILGHAESLHALSMGGGGANYFYGNVTLQIGEDAAGGLLEYR